MISENRHKNNPGFLRGYHVLLNIDVLFVLKLVDVTYPYFVCASENNQRADLK